MIDSFDALLDACYQDFGGVYDEVKSKPDIEAHETVSEDGLIQRGSLDYFRKKAQV